MPTPEITPADRMSTYWATLRRRWRLVAALVATAVLAGVGVGIMSSQSYDATSKVLIGQRTQLDALLGASDYAPDPEREVNTSLALASLEPVAGNVRRRLGLHVGTGALLAKLSAQIDGNSNVVSLTVRDASPKQAARLANAFALGFRDFVASSSQASIEDGVAAAKERAAAMEPGPERDALEAEVRRLEAAGAFKASGVQVVREATAASATPTRNVAANAILAGLLGLVLAAVVVVVLARTDKRVHEEDELEEIVGGPVLGVVPDRLDSGSETVGRDAFATVALSLALRGMQPRGAEAGSRNGAGSLVLLLASPGRSDGTATVTLGLARALAEMGTHVIALEADLRAPRLTTELGAEPTDGLVGILTEGRSLQHELVRFPWGAGGYVPAGVDAGASGLPRPQTLLAGAGAARVVAEARRRADVVLIAGAPVGDFADSLALVPLVDAVLVVARLGSTRADRLERAVEALDGLDARVAGVVATARHADGRRPLRARSPAVLDDVAGPPHLDATANGSAANREVTT